MTSKQIDMWLEAAYEQLEKRISEQEDEFVSMFVGYISKFYVDDTRLKDTIGNYNMVYKINDLFDEAYDIFITPFLVWYASTLMESANISRKYFEDLGEKTSDKDTEYVAAMVGYVGGRVVKNSFLWNLGHMGELRQRLQDMVINAISSTQKLSVAIRNIKPIFKSSKKSRSTLSKYYLKFAYEPIMHILSTTSYRLAKKYGYTHFAYSGGLVEKSRSFCIERNGNTYTLEEGKSWNNLDWNGKIDGLDFFIQIGGYNCRHYLEFKKTDE
jgi:hypothetical protein